MTSKRSLLALIVIIILLVVGSVAYYMQSHDTFTSGSAVVANGDDLTQDDVDKTVKAVGKHMILPEGEEPVAAKIVDVDELLKTQPFYRGAINGDILLIYQAAAKAILYSPSRDLLVNVGPIVRDDADTTSTDTTPVEADASEEGSADTEDVQ